MNRSQTRLATAVVASSALVALPSASWSLSEALVPRAEVKHTFNPGRLPVTGQRLPSSGGWSMPSRSGTGVVRADVGGCYTIAAIHFRLKRERTGPLPEATQYSRTGLRYCAGILNDPGVSWPTGKYHFDVLPQYDPQPSEPGWLAVQW